MVKYKNYFLLIFILLIFYNLFLIPYFYKKITRCYITLEVSYFVDKDSVLSQVVDKAILKYNDISSLHSITYKTKDLKEINKSIYRIINKEVETCNETYTKLSKELDSALKNEVDIIILDDTKTKVRLITFYIINNLILIILLSAIYLSFSERISLKLKIEKN